MKRLDLTEAEFKALVEALEIAYCDDDAPIRDTPEGRELLNSLKAKLGAEV